MQRPFLLSPRLHTVAELVPHGAKLVDIGTDHGRLPVWLIQHGIIDHAVASDLRPAPLSRAKEFAARWGVSEQIEFRLCDGLSDISPQEAQVVTIAGMGGETIANILHTAKWPEKEPGHRYILQAMSGMDGLRRYLSGHGYVIRQEQLVPEGNTLYVILWAELGETPAFTEGEIWVGRQSPDLKSPFRNQYLTQELQKLRHAVIGLSKSQRFEDAVKQRQYQLAVDEVTKMKEEWEQWQQ